MMTYYASLLRRGYRGQEALAKKFGDVRAERARQRTLLFAAKVLETFDPIRFSLFGFLDNIPSFFSSPIGRERIYSNSHF
jgi:hypothetical protein